MATLIVTAGPAEGQQFALGDHRLVMLGRDATCTFQILDEQMSRRHMQIKRESGDGHSAVDFGSANGVFVNKAKIETPTPLADGDELDIGGSRLLYTTADSPDAQTINALLRKRGEHFKSTLMRGPDDA